MGDYNTGLQIAGMVAGMTGLLMLLDLIPQRRKR